MDASDGEGSADAAQAVVKFLARAYSERDGVRPRLIEGRFGTFGHGNIAGLGQALMQMQMQMRMQMEVEGHPRAGDPAAALGTSSAATSRPWCTTR